MLKRSIAFLTCSMLVFPSSGCSWGNKGHQTVGRIAQNVVSAQRAIAHRLFTDNKSKENQRCYKL